MSTHSTDVAVSLQISKSTTVAFLKSQSIILRGCGWGSVGKITSSASMGPWVQMPNSRIKSQAWLHGPGTTATPRFWFSGRGYLCVVMGTGRERHPMSSLGLVSLTCLHGPLHVSVSMLVKEGIMAPASNPSWGKRITVSSRPAWATQWAQG